MTILSVGASPAGRRAFDDVFGGLAASALTITYGLSYALLIFAGPLAPYLGQGLGITFIVSAVLALVLAFGSSLRFAIGAPDSSTAAVTAILTSSLIDRIVAVDPNASIFAPAVITFGLTSIATGLVLCGCGMSRLGRAIRYVPYPVVGGFLGATGALIVFGAIRVITGQRLQLGSLASFANPQTAYQLTAALAMALLLYLTWHRSRSPFGLPAILVAVTLATHVGFRLAGISPADAQAMGWTFQPPGQASFVWGWDLHALAQYPWHMLPDMSGDLIAVAFVTAASTLFNTAGIEVATHREADIERELTATGIANILSGLLGGYTGCISISRTILNFKAGGSGRLSGVTVAAVSVLMLVLAPSLLGYMPKFVLGGLLLYLGADTLHKWAVQSRRRLSRTDYVSLLAIILIILQWGFIAGILIGVLIGCIAFALSASRINSIKYSFDGTEYRSSLDRSRHDQALLATHGSEIQGLNLQSYLFFGSANRLYQYVKALLMRRPECRFLVFDFKLVTGIDSSAAYSFAQIKRVAQERGIKLVLVHVPPAVERALRASEFITPDVAIAPELDHALEWCEDAIISRHQGHPREEASLRDWFAQILGSQEEASELMHRCERLEVAAGSTIVRAGDAADSMHFILDGRVGVMIPAEHAGATRVRSLGRYTTIGEMGLVAHTPRSATIQAETDSVLYVLTTRQFEAITRDRPALGQKLLVYFVTVMAERLSFANRAIAVLRR
ncbi:MULTISPECIES: SLC26A/SulP transporter family protein [unclassified Bradyrhizobium]|uniref:SLC26A/SulP transporter family protein n=1 Tax=unclassified Bradyrhizobium TaxID=2631580 RepID=UPI0028EF0ACA|nr:MULTISPECIES: SulP family inorganic anion transporter [unclassified Bradyrhizobium]